MAATVPPLITEENCYQDAQRAHDEIFLAESANPEVDKQYQSFLDQYQARAQQIRVDISGLTSRARIILIRKMIQHICDGERQKKAGERKETKTVFYRYHGHGHDYECEHVPVKEDYRSGSKVFNTNQPGSVILDGIGKYFKESAREGPSIQDRLEEITRIVPSDEIGAKIRASRTTGQPIRAVGVTEVVAGLNVLLNYNSQSHNFRIGTVRF